VLNILGLGWDEEMAFGQGLSPTEREACGTYEQWCPKDMLAHCAYWKQRMAGRLTAAAKGEALEDTGEYEEANAACFAEHRDETWEQVMAYAEQAHRALVTAVETVDERVLNDASYSPDPGGRLLWSLVVGTGYTHPVTHLASYSAAQGQADGALQLQQQANAELAKLDDSPQWRGGLLYNMACIHALAGQPDGAIDELRQALALRPDLAEWSKEDTDLASLRDRADYQALYVD
jgi:tetratricopeptide (TPR) repeat protein